MRFVVLGCVLLAACASPGATEAAATPTVRILLVGDVMTGRGLATNFETEPDEIFAGVRHLLSDADIVGANLESPLTDRPHVSANENVLIADPGTAISLAGAGFDVLALPNNHSTDAGPAGVVDTIDAVTGAGMVTVGAGADSTAAATPTIIEAQGLTVGLLAFDATGIATAAGDEPGVAVWDPEASVAATEDLGDRVDVVIVSVHGGAEYLPVTDPGMADISEALASAGADVVWGHGAHVVQPVTVLEGGTVAATSLGNFLFDQSGPDRTTGAMLEVIADESGVVAYRAGLAEHPDRYIEFVDWIEPSGDAGWLRGSWWSLIRSPTIAVGTSIELDEFRHGDLVTATGGDIDGDGDDDVVASFRRPHETTPFMETHPEVQWADTQGRSAHLGVYEPDSLVEVWVAGTVLRPIADLEICDGSLAVAHDYLDDPTVIAAGAWIWNGFGFDTAPDITGRGDPACADIDGDGQTDPVIVGR